MFLFYQLTTYHWQHPISDYTLEVNSPLSTEVSTFLLTISYRCSRHAICLNELCFCFAYVGSGATCKGASCSDIMVKYSTCIDHSLSHQVNQDIQQCDLYNFSLMDTYLPVCWKIRFITTTTVMLLALACLKGIDLRTHQIFFIALVILLCASDQDIAASACSGWYRSDN